jgi:hypothetical protein
MRGVFSKDSLNERQSEGGKTQASVKETGRIALDKCNRSARFLCTGGPIMKLSRVTVRVAYSLHAGPAANPLQLLFDRDRDDKLFVISRL